jgi:hypothetical protein
MGGAFLARVAWGAPVLHVYADQRIDFAGKEEGGECEAVAEAAE